MSTPVVHSDLIDGLNCLGAAPTCHLMVHASLSQFGRVEGGADTVVAALRETAGPQGAVVVPSFRDAIRSDVYALRECQAICPQSFCPSRERGYTGIIGETLRQLPGALRSCHPTHSWVGVGGDARYLLEGHRESPTPCGRESPFFRLMERDGLVLLLGVGVNSLTNVHAIEDVRNVPYLSAIDPRRRHATYTTSGRRIQYRYPQSLERSLRECQLLRTQRIGTAVCHSIRARDLGAFLWRATEDDPWCLVLRPQGDRYDPAADAAAKTARMTQVWLDRPEKAAWKQLLTASREPTTPRPFTECGQPRTDCPAYRGVVRGHPRCAANDLPPWERFEDYPTDEPGVATCDTCNWPATPESAHNAGAAAGVRSDD